MFFGCIAFLYKEGLVSWQSIPDSPLLHVSFVCSFYFAAVRKRFSDGCRSAVEARRQWPVPLAPRQALRLTTSASPYVRRTYGHRLRSALAQNRKR